MIVPVADVKAGYLARKREYDDAISQCMNSGWYIHGQNCSKFEVEFANFCSVPYGIGVGSGTDAIELALRSLDVEPHSCVLTPSHTAVATISAIERAGLLPVFVDINEQTYTLAPDATQQTIEYLHKAGKKIAAIIAVHLYGHMADMTELYNISENYKISLIEDCAQAHGATLNGSIAGATGELGCFSFYPTKNLGAFGDGGMIVTSKSQYNTKIRELREYGWRDRYISENSGVNSRLDEIQASLLRVGLKYLNSNNSRRIEIAGKYCSELRDINLILPKVKDNAVHVYHQFVVRIKNRLMIQEKLNSCGVQTAVHYPQAVHMQPAYSKRDELFALPLTVTEKVIPEILSLPVYPELSNKQIDHVINSVKNIA